MMLSGNSQNVSIIILPFIGNSVGVTVSEEVPALEVNLVTYNNGVIMLMCIWRIHAVLLYAQMHVCDDLLYEKRYNSDVQFLYCSNQILLVQCVFIEHTAQLYYTRFLCIWLKKNKCIFQHTY